jgi:hypothetical protein
MPLPQGRHFSTLAEHQFEALLRRQGPQVGQFELNFRSLVMGV